MEKMKIKYYVLAFIVFGLWSGDVMGQIPPKGDSSKVEDDTKDRFELNTSGDTYHSYPMGRVLIGQSSEADIVNEDDLIVRENIVLGTSNGIASTTDPSLSGARGVFIGDAGSILDNDNQALNFVGRESIKFYTNEATSAAEPMTINTEGQVLINTDIAPTDTSYKLAVAGKMISEETRVRLQADWPDYVFGPEYELTPLGELESQITELGHLPNIPSAEDIQTDGLALGEMKVKQLEKIEELTIYMIEMDKAIRLLEEENEALKQALNP